MLLSRRHQRSFDGSRPGLSELRRQQLRNPGVHKPCEIFGMRLKVYVKFITYQVNSKISGHRNENTTPLSDICAFVRGLGRASPTNYTSLKMLPTYIMEMTYQDTHPPHQILQCRGPQSSSRTSCSFSVSRSPSLNCRSNPLLGILSFPIKLTQGYPSHGQQWQL